MNIPPQENRMGILREHLDHILITIIVIIAVATLGQTASALAQDTAQDHSGALLQAPPFCGDGICQASALYLPYHEDAVSCPADCSIYCGDGICDEYYGENVSTCPDDCATPTPTNTAVPTATYTPTETPIATETGTPTTTPTASPTATDTPRPEVTTEEPGDEGTATPTELPDYTPTPTLDIPTGCGLVAYESRSGSWQDAYSTTGVEGYIPSRQDDLEVYVCSEPPLGQICFLIYDGLLDAAQGDLARIGMVDCSAGACQIVQRVGQKRGDQICYTIRRSDNVSCEEGCALTLLAEPLRVGLTTGSIIFISTGVAGGIGLGILLLLILARRRKEEDEEEEEV
ncbi:MAG: hypothetical protein JW963_01700 [Anaerolineales bacterium]|nr:hypothetical protein [Anaerolineales bacterium]